MVQPLDASKSNPLEGGPSFSVGHRTYRLVWNAVWLVLASWTPPPLHQWRLLLLRIFGATVHPKARVYGSARIWYPPNLVLHAYAVLGPRVNCYCMARIEVGEKAIVSQGVYLCGGTHDIRSRDFQLKTRPILVQSGAWIAAEAFVGPGVTVGERAVVGARAVLFKDAVPYGVYLGNPATLIKVREFRD